MQEMSIIEKRFFSKQMRKRIAAYCRVSTDRSDQHSSFETQQEYFRQNFKNSESEELVGVYSDTNSGTSALCRPGFQRLLSDCRDRKIDRIVTKSLSRFARNTKECLNILRELKQIGVTVLFEKECIDTARITDEMMITIMESLAQEEAASISRNVRWSIKRRMANGTFGIARVPFGYNKVNGKLEINKEKADIIRRIYSLYLSGAGARRISAMLNSENVLSPNNTKWNSVTVLKILKQEKYIGDIRWQKTYSTFMGEKWKINRGERDSYYIRNCLPPIISREDFAAVHEIIERSKRQPQNKVSSPFRKKTKCICGRSFYLRNGYTMKWICSGKYDQANPCCCPTFLDGNYHKAWERMCIKLKKFSDKVITPSIELLCRVENNLIREEMEQLRAEEAELLRRKYIMCFLCSQGFITGEKLIAVQNEIDMELDDIRRKKQLLDEQGSKTSCELFRLIGFTKCLSPDNLPDNILKRAVSDGRTIEFELIGGLCFREVL